MGAIIGITILVLGLCAVVFWLALAFRDALRNPSEREE